MCVGGGEGAQIQEWGKYTVRKTIKDMHVNENRFMLNDDLFLSFQVSLKIWNFQLFVLERLVGSSPACSMLTGGFQVSLSYVSMINIDFRRSYVNIPNKKLRNPLFIC